MKKIKFLIAAISLSIISIVGASVAVFSNVTDNTISFFHGARANLDHVLSINCDGYNQGTIGTNEWNKSETIQYFSNNSKTTSIPLKFYNFKKPTQTGYLVSLGKAIEGIGAGYICSTEGQGIYNIRGIHYIGFTIKALDSTYNGGRVTLKFGNRSINEFQYDCIGNDVNKGIFDFTDIQANMFMIMCTGDCSLVRLKISYYCETCTHLSTSFNTNNIFYNPMTPTGYTENLVMNHNNRTSRFITPISYNGEYFSGKYYALKIKVTLNRTKNLTTDGSNDTAWGHQYIGLGNSSNYDSHFKNPLPDYTLAYGLSPRNDGSSNNGQNHVIRSTEMNLSNHQNFSGPLCSSYHQWQKWEKDDQGNYVLPRINDFDAFTTPFYLELIRYDNYVWFYYTSTGDNNPVLCYFENIAAENEGFDKTLHEFDYFYNRNGTPIIFSCNMYADIELDEFRGTQVAVYDFLNTNHSIYFRNITHKGWQNSQVCAWLSDPQVTGRPCPIRAWVWGGSCGNGEWKYAEASTNGDGLVTIYGVPYDATYMKLYRMNSGNSGCFDNWGDSTVPNYDGTDANQRGRIWNQTGNISINSSNNFYESDWS